MPNESTGGVNGKVIDDGGSAFPFVSHGSVAEHQFCVGGISKRDYFAAAALQAAFREEVGTARILIEKLHGREDNASQLLADAAAKLSYLLADAMLAASKGESNAK